jgi:hypothetical protein
MKTFTVTLACFCCFGCAPVRHVAPPIAPPSLQYFECPMSSRPGELEYLKWDLDYVISHPFAPPLTSRPLRRIVSDQIDFRRS